MERITAIKHMNSEELGQFLTDFSFDGVMNWFCKNCPNKEVCDSIGKCDYEEEDMMYSWLHEDIGMPHCDKCGHASPDDCRHCTYRKECEL